jgi:hypothetical protein
MADFMIELKGTPEDVQAMVNQGSRIDGAVAYKKKWINPGLCRVWYRGKRTAPNDLVAAIKRKAGLTKSKAKPKATRARKAIEVSADDASTSST